MSTNILALSISLVVGSGLGILYFKSLWFTVDRLTSVRRPALWMISSLALRLAALLIGLYVVLQTTGPIGLLLATAGVVLGRTVCLYLSRTQRRKREMLS